MLACFCSDRRVEADELGQPDQFNKVLFVVLQTAMYCTLLMHKVEAAFRKFDVDKDGFLSWEEFQQVEATAIRILLHMYEKKTIAMEYFAMHYYLRIVL